MNNKKMTKGMLALLLVTVMLSLTLINAFADDGKLSDADIDAIINTQTDASQVTSPFITVADSVRNSVVGVNNYTTSYSYNYGYGYYGRNGSSRENLSGTGSGVVISSYGHVLTNYHVVEGASRVTVTIANDESEHAALVAGYDADLDIAILLVPGLELPAVPLGDSDQLQVGEWAIVIGNPLGEEFARTLTVGVVSALDRVVTDTSYDRYGRRTSITNTMIQVDAAINSGNSGGGMFNVLGQLQGIPSRKYSASGFFTTTSIDNIGMCIPINVAKPLIEQVLRDYDGSMVTEDNTEEPQDTTAATADSPLLGKPRLGVTVTSITSQAVGVLPQGALVKEVEEGSPASEGGLLPGDIIVEVDGEITASSDAVIAKVQGHNEGDKIQLKVFRDPGLAAQIENSMIDLTQVGEGEYVELTVILRVIDNRSM
ncbi:MAG: trypsin-like peptidase domain-containing protein [Clostridia bacterium]|nr:trypsin-like peptidase domain-containing protein [Clostridia bacterium]